MNTLKLRIIPFMMISIVTTACANTLEEKKVNKPKKEATMMVFPTHPGAIKMITMLDKTVKITPISEVPERHQFVYYDKYNHKVEKENAVKATPIVEVRMYSKAGGKLVPTKKASYIYIEMYDSKGNIIDTHTMWSDGIRGGKRKTK